VFDMRPASFEEIEAGLRAHGFEDDPRVGEIVELHAAMLADPAITRVEHLCRHAGYSKRTLQRLFREYVGVTPKWVLERIRLHEAAERMAEGEQDWPALALDLGYFDQAHFIKAFKAVVGRSPADYALRASVTVG
jgi:AraC-like DNA-binding protein